MRALSLLLAGLVATTVAAGASASEPAGLEELEVGQIGTASLVAFDSAEADLDPNRDDDSDAEGASFATVWAETSMVSRHDRGWSRPQQALGVGIELGVYASRWSALDLHTRGWLYMPGVAPGVAGTMRTDVRAAAGLPLGGLAVDLELDGRIALASDGDRGMRRYDVAPLPYFDAALDPTVWVTSRSRDDDEVFGLALDYDGRTTRYLDAGFGGRTSHRGGIGMGFRDYGLGFRGTMRWLNLGYTRHRAGELPPTAPIALTYLPAPPVAQNEVDFTWFSGDFDFGESGAGGDAYSRAHVRLDTGWSFLWPTSESFAHTPKMRVMVDYRDPEVGHYGGAVHHRAEIAPAGYMVGITSFEAAARIESDEFPLALALLGDFARVEALPHGSRADAWFIRGDGELYAHLDVFDVGAEGTLGRGLPTGSLGWAPSSAEPRFWGRAGGFARLRTPF